MKRMLFVYNPNAGKGTLKNKLLQVLNIFSKEDYEMVVHPTKCRQDAYHTIKNIKQDYDLVVCSGGDGTLDEVVTGMMEHDREKRIPIGYIPTGTTNDFASSLSIPKNVMKAAEIAVTGEQFACDVGTFNDDVFIYVAGFGLFTDVSYQTDQKLKSALGHAAYVLEGAKRLIHIPSFHVKVTLDGKVIEDDFMIALFSNSHSIAGFRGLMGKDVVFDDGKFEVTLIKKPHNLLQAKEIMSKMLSGKRDSKYIYACKASEIIVESEKEIPWTLDGEFGGDHKKVQIINKKQAVDIIVKPSEKEEK